MNWNHAFALVGGVLLAGLGGELFVRGLVLRTVTPGWNERWALLALGFVPLVVLELAKLRSGRTTPSRASSKD
jgi:hypothetical protein